MVENEKKVGEMGFVGCSLSQQRWGESHGIKAAHCIDILEDVNVHMNASLNVEDEGRGG